mgnify:FL=1
MRYDQKSLKLSENRCMKNSIKKVQEKHYKQNYKNELKFKKYKLKNYKLKQAGITIIALVVTIIILLILAGITISMVSNDGILGKAKNVAAVSDRSSAEEEMSMYLAGIDIQREQEGNTGRLADYLSSNVGNNGLEDFLNNGDGYAQVAYNGHNFLVNLDDGTFTYIGKSTGTGVNRHLKQILNSNNQDVPGVAMVEAGEIETEDLGWKVLSTNEDGTVNLIANTNTGFEVSISGINGYTNGVKALNEICSKLYGSLEINGKKVLSARSANAEDFYNITYTVSRKYENGKKIEPIINQLDTANNGYSTNQISDYIDIANTSGAQSSNTQMLVANTSPTIKNQNRTNKSTVSLMNTGNNYWLATRYANSDWNKGTDGKTPYSEELSNEYYQLAFARTDGAYSKCTMFQTNQNYSTSGSNEGGSCSLRPVITVSANSVSDASVGATVNVDKFYKNKSGSEAHGYIKADSIAALLGKDIKSINKVNSGLPTVESDMTWSKLTDGGYDLQSGSFDTSKYDYYIADRATKLQVRLTGAPAYNNGVLALDTICNNLYGNLTEIKLKNGKTKKVKVVLARDAKWEDFIDESKINNSSYGNLWTTNADDTSAPSKITSTYNSFAPTLFTQYENIDRTKGASKGYSDAKISSYNMNTKGTSNWLSTDKKENYAYERYNNDKKSSNPWLKVIYNAYWRGSNRNTSNIRGGAEFWLSSRCVNAYWNRAYFSLRFVSSSGSITAGYVFDSGTGVFSSCHGLRPVLQVAK